MHCYCDLINSDLYSIKLFDSRFLTSEHLNIVQRVQTFNLKA